MESSIDTNPRRVVLRFQAQHELEKAAISRRFFALHGPKPPADVFFSHLMAPNESSKMHTVLDMYCKSYPAFDSGKIPYEVFKVRKKGELYVAHIPCQKSELSKVSVSLRGSTTRRVSMHADDVRESNGPPTELNSMSPMAFAHCRRDTLRPRLYLEHLETGPGPLLVGHLGVDRYPDSHGLAPQDGADSQSSIRDSGRGDSWRMS